MIAAGYIKKTFMSVAGIKMFLNYYNASPLVSVHLSQEQLLLIVLTICII